MMAAGRSIHARRFLRIRCDNSGYERLGHRFACKSRLFGPQRGPATGPPAPGVGRPRGHPAAAAQVRAAGAARPRARRRASGGRLCRTRGWGSRVLLLIVGLMGGFFIGRAQYSGDSAAARRRQRADGGAPEGPHGLRGPQLDVLPDGRGPQGGTRPGYGLDVDDSALVGRGPGQLLRRRLPGGRGHPRRHVRRRGQRHHRLLGPAQGHRRVDIVDHRERHPEGTVRPHHRAGRHGGGAARGHLTPQDRGRAASRPRA